MKLKKIIDYIPLLAIVAIIFQPLIGMKLYYVVMAIMIGTTGINIIKNKRITINYFELIFILFILLGFASKLYAISQPTANYAIKELILSFLIAFSIVEFTQRGRERKCENRYMKILNVFCISAVILSIYLCVFDLPRVFGTRDRLGRLLYEEYGTYMVFSYILIISICYLLWQCFYKKGSKLKYLSLVILVLTGILSGTRKTIICPIIFAFLLILYKYRKEYKKLTIFMITGVICMGVVYNILISNENLYKLIGMRIESLVQEVFNNGKQNNNIDNSIKERTLLKELSIKAFNEKPLLGWGINNFANYSEQHSGPFLYAHSNYLELLSSLGIVGVTIYYAGHLYIIVSAVKKIKNCNDEFSVYILIFMIMNLIADFATVSYYRIQFMLIFELFAKYVNEKGERKMKDGTSRTIANGIFFAFPPRFRELFFYLNFFKKMPEKMDEIRTIKKLYKEFNSDFGKYKKDKKNIYKSMIKLSIKKDDGIELAKEFYKDNLQLIKKGNINDRKIILICLVKNDLKRITEFYKHYKQLGVENYVFIDNDSTDGTSEFLEQLEDTTIFKIYDKYTTIRRQAWITKAMAYFGYNNWYLIVDSDELLVYNNCENKNVDELIEIARRKREHRVKALMLDMYSDEKFLSDSQEDDKNLKEKYCYFDNDTYYHQEHKCFELINGGMRKRVFGKYEDISPFLIKYPIIFYEKGDLQYNSHYSYPFYKNFDKELNIALLHYKFLKEDLEKIRIRVKEKNYASGSKEYNAYLKAYQEDKNLKLTYSKSQKYDNSKALEKIDFMEQIDWRK